MARKVNDFDFWQSRSNEPIGKIVFEWGTSYWSISETKKLLISGLIKNTITKPEYRGS